jgi:hypothetical protein
MIDGCIGNRPEVRRQFPAPKVVKDRETVTFSVNGRTPASAMMELTKKINEAEEAPDFFVVSISHNLFVVPNGFFASAMVVKSSTKPTN